MKQSILAILIALIFWFLSPEAVSANYQLPSFDSCHNPSGTIKADYPVGQHAIVGINGLQNGSDKVFTNGNDNYTQCFCPPSGNTGIKTNWLAAGNISKEDTNVLITQGWVYIEKGADWGLSSQPYLAKNIEFSCGSTGDSSGGGGGTDQGSGGGTSSGNGGIGGGGGGEVLGISTLASTSNPLTRYQILLTILVSIGLIIYGYKIQKNS